MESNCNKIYLGSSSIETAISPGSRKAVTVIYLWSRNCTSAGSQSPADIVRIRKSHQDTPDGSFPILFEGGR